MMGTTQNADPQPSVPKPHIPKDGQGPVIGGLDKQGADKESDPFLEGDNPFYPGGQRLENLESLRHLVHFSNRILLVTGDQGSGKTFLLNRLVEYEKAALKFVRVDPGLLQGSNSLLQHMAELSGLSLADNKADTELLAKIDASCRKRSGNGCRTLFVIDNAQDLSDDSLNMLISVFGSEVEPAFGLLMLAQPQIIERIRNPITASERQPVHQIQLKNLTKDETIAYTNYYLDKFGWDKAIADTPQLQAKLHELGRGIPGRINRIASSLLQAPHEQSPRFQLKPAYLFIGGITLAMAVTLLLTVRQYSEVESSEHLSGKPTITLQIPRSTPTDISPKKSASDKRVQDNRDNDRFRSNTRQTPTNIDDKSAHEIDISHRPILAEGVGEAGIVLESKAEASNNRPQEDISGHLNTGADSGSKLKVFANRDTGLVETTDTLAQPVVSETKQEKQRIASIISSAESSAAGVSPEIVESNSLIRSQEWLNAQPEDGWTIQILGGRNEDTVVKYLSELKVGGDYFYVRSSYQGKEWFVVLHGIYVSKEEARNALNGLPLKQRSAGAWIRNLSGMQQ